MDFAYKRTHTYTRTLNSIHKYIKFFFTVQWQTRVHTHTHLNHTLYCTVLAAAHFISLPMTHIKYSNTLRHHSHESVDRTLRGVKPPTSVNINNAYTPNGIRLFSFIIYYLFAFLVTSLLSWK